MSNTNKTTLFVLIVLVVSVLWGISSSDKIAAMKQRLTLQTTEEKLTRNNLQSIQRGKILLSDGSVIADKREIGTAV